jgi:hypothetical protein
MTDLDFPDAAETDIVDTYRSAASRHGRFSAEGDYKKANPEAELIAAVYRDLRVKVPRSQPPSDPEGFGPMPRPVASAPRGPASLACTPRSHQNRLGLRDRRFPRR